MPSTATITSFWSFAANTKARSSQVNTNFSNFRGHIIAIDPNTIAASNNTYDLGSTEYRWRNSYVQSVDFQSNTTTGNALVLRADTATSYGGFIVEAGGTEIFRASKNSGMTTAAAKGQRAYSAVFSFVTASASSHTVASSLITLASSGKLVRVELMPANTTLGSSIAFNNNTTTATNANGNISLYQNGSWVGLLSFQQDFIDTTGASAPIASNMNPHTSWMVNSTAGTNTFYIVYQSNSGVQTLFSLNNLVLTAKEEF